MSDVSKRDAVKVYQVTLAANLSSRNASRTSLPDGNSTVSKADKPLGVNSDSLGSSVLSSHISSMRPASMATSRFDSDSEADSNAVSPSDFDAALASKVGDWALNYESSSRPSQHVLQERELKLDASPSSTQVRPLVTREMSAESFVPIITNISIDLSTWTSEVQVPAQVEDDKNAVPHLPPISTNASPVVSGEGGAAVREERTSLPMFSEDVKQGIESTIQGTMYEIFERTMRSPSSRREFREWLSNTHRDVSAYDLWKDLNAFRALSRNVTLCAAALHELGDSVNRGSLPAELRTQLDEGLQHVMGFEEKLVAPQAYLLDAIYKADFQEYIRHLSVIECEAMLQNASTIHAQHGAAFCLTNPRQRDHPIQLVSPGFEELTGYEAKHIVGRNCRFLSGPQTFDITTTKMREAIHEGQSFDTVILNYRNSGEPFYNLLSVAPIRDSHGALCYFLGSQTDVTDLLEKHLRKLLSLQEPQKRDGTSGDGIVDEFSPSFRLFAAAVGLTTQVENHEQGDHDDLSGKEMPIVHEIAGFQLVLQDHSTTSVSSAGATTRGASDAGRKKKGSAGSSSSGSGMIKKLWDKMKHHHHHQDKGQLSPMNKAGANGAQRSETNLNDVGRIAPVSFPDHSIWASNWALNNHASACSLQFSESMGASISAEPHALHSRLLVFVVPSRQIVYLTPSTIHFLGNRGSSTTKPDRSNLLQTDVLSLITTASGPSSPLTSPVGETSSGSHHSNSFLATLSAGERVREKFLDAVAEGKEKVLKVGIRIRKTRLDYPVASIDQTIGDRIAKVKIRLSPLKRGDSKVEAFVLVFL
ncbi:BQ2448_3818 [Microbotryum intermedium]|uniref:BQ2448_3818 protein n=1 Tax=Microbotryum intermedium TaxID=269621 RepID=A0A238FJ06_9BASI|nr:BQ2448_3818 [Microbotryum intermedium]